MKAILGPLRELLCESEANETGFCTISLADTQFYLFDALGKNSEEG